MSHALSPLSRKLLRHASLRQIEVFESVARNESFTRAAAELNLTQPSVSAQVKSLADTLELALYEQIGRQIYLTEAGQIVLRGCREVIDALSNIEMSLNELKGFRQGRLRLSVITTAKYFAPLALGDFAQQYPEIELELMVSNRDTLMRRIEENFSDLYIMGQLPKARIDLEVIPFAPNPLVIIAHRKHPLANVRQIPLARIAQEPFIMREVGSGIRHKLEELFSSQGFAIKTRMVLDGNEAIKHAVAGKLGLSVVSAHALNIEGDGGPLVKLDVQGFPLESYWNIVYPRGKALSVISRKFLSFLLQHGGDYLHIN